MNVADRRRELFTAGKRRQWRQERAAHARSVMGWSNMELGRDDILKEPNPWIMILIWLGCILIFLAGVALSNFFHFPALNAQEQPAKQVELKLGNERIVSNSELDEGLAKVYRYFESCMSLDFLFLETFRNKNSLSFILAIREWNDYANFLDRFDWRLMNGFDDRLCPGLVLTHGVINRDILQCEAAKKYILLRRIVAVFQGIAREKIKHLQSELKKLEASK